jgi:demethylmenaquinone methyltransferase/2-methoxy-6-polyprenyl-1,4-benzoquinol methylase
VPLGEKQTLVNGVFHSVASRYDLMNDLMSAGLHRVWKDIMINALNPPRGDAPFALLDVAGGTGDISFRAARAAGHGFHATVCDINPDMLAVGRERAEKRGLEGLAWAEENAERLSFAGSRFDGYTIAFGIRNVTDIPAALGEAHRVLKTGGRFFCLEFSTTRWPGFASLYDAYSMHAVPRIGKAVASDEESYRYLVESIRRFPPVEAFSAMIAKAGFAQVRAEPILGGLVAIHSGWKV